MINNLTRAELIAKLKASSALPNIRKAKQIKRRGESSVESLPGEIWTDVAGWEGYYQTSNLGRVKSLDRMVFGSHGSTYLRRGVLLMPTKQEGASQYRFHLSSVELGKNIIVPIDNLLTQTSVA